MSNFFNYSSFPGIRPRSDVDAADMSRSSAARRIAADVVVAAGVLALFGVVAWLLPQINEPIGPSGVPSTVSDDLHLLPYSACSSRCFCHWCSASSMVWRRPDAGDCAWC